MLMRFISQAHPVKSSVTFSANTFTRNFLHNSRQLRWTLKNFCSRSNVNLLTSAATSSSTFLHRRNLNTIGHKTEFGFGHRKNVKQRNKIKGPLVPRHPKMHNRKNLDFLVTYRDLKIRWSKTKRAKRISFMHIKRRRPLRLSSEPSPEPTSAFILHDRMPHKTKMPALPTIHALSTADAFAVVKTNIDKQHKVTKGDLILTQRVRRKQAGDKVVFGTVLLVGSRDWTIIGKPTVPYAKVVCTVEQQTLSKEHISFRFGTKWSRLKRTRHYVSILHVDEIVIDPKLKEDAQRPPRPIRLLDIWANRWLDPDELEGVRYKSDGISPAVEDIYDGQEPKPGLFHRNGLTSCYRFSPDPYAPNEFSFVEEMQREKKASSDIRRRHKVSRPSSKSKKRKAVA